MSWQPLQVATNLCLLGPSGHSFSVYCAWATGAPTATMTNANISELPRMVLLPPRFCDQGFVREQDFERIKPSSYSLRSASLPFPSPSSFGPGPARFGFHSVIAAMHGTRCATNLNRRPYAGLFQVACKFANRARANRELFRHLIRAFLAPPRASGAVRSRQSLLSNLRRRK